MNFLYKQFESKTNIFFWSGMGGGGGGGGVLE